MRGAMEGGGMCKAARRRLGKKIWVGRKVMMREPEGLKYGE